jgi:hypothetical protein
MGEKRNACGSLVGKTERDYFEEAVIAGRMGCPSRPYYLKTPSFS